MENCWDFLQWLGQDVSASVLARLDEPADLVRASAVSRSWRRFGTYSFLLEFALVRYPRKECFLLLLLLLSLTVVLFANERNVFSDGKCTGIASIFMRFNTSSNIRTMRYCRNFVSPGFMI